MHTRHFFKNFISLYGIQLASMVLPLVSIPYLARTLKPDTMGEFSAIQALATTLSLFVEYGFVFSATRQISLSRHDNIRLSEIASQVLSSKLILSLIVLMIFCFLGYFVPEYRNEGLLFVFGGLYAVFQGFSPIWYFQGIEELPGAAIVDLICRIFGTLLLFIFVNGPQQAWLVMAIQSLFVILSVAINHSRMYRHFSFKNPTLEDARIGLTEGWSMFLFRASVSLYTTANITLLRLFVSAPSVAYYANADKLANIAKAGVQPVTQILFPRVSRLLLEDRQAAILLIRKSSLLFMSIAILLTILTWYAAPFFVPWFLGREYRNSIELLQLLSLSIPIIALSNILGIHWMLPNKMDKIFNSIIIGGGIANIVLIFLLVPNLGSRGMAYSVLASEILIDFAMVFFLLRENNFPFCGLRSDL